MKENKKDLSRQRFFDLVETVREENRAVPAEQMDEAIAEAIAEVRSAKRTQQRHA